MTGLKTVIRKEFMCLLGGGKGVFVVYAVITALWSVALLFECADAAAGGAGPDVGDGMRLWFVFFAVVAGANFSATVFISERVNGALEVFITSGLSRDAVLFGKMAFVMAATAVLGALCAGMAVIWDLLRLFAYDAHVLRALGANNALIYLSAAFMNAAASAYFSIRLPNPRFLHLINMLLTAAIIAVSGLPWTKGPLLPAAFFITGALFTLLARREFAGERVIRPVIF